MVNDTRSGRIRGLDTNGCSTFLGIRYGEPPVAEQRFMPPIAAGSWTGIYDATQWPNRPMQPNSLGTMGQPTPGDLSEDCLFLNVYTPGVGGERRPVMVWIHGGGFTGGSANEYDGRVLARQGDVVVVTINYRLGPFGFLNLAPLNKSLTGSGSNGIRDMVLALAWVRDNIVDYGGNPENVTVFGESAGAKAILGLSGTPTAAGLYHKAIAHSPAAAAPAPGDKTGAMAERLGIDRSDLLTTLRSMPAQDLLEAGLPAGHEVDGAVVTEPFIQALSANDSPDIPMIIGTNRTEATLFTPADSPDEGMEEYEKSLARSARGVIGDKDPTHYVAGLKSAYPDKNAKQLMEMISTDHFRKTSVDVAEIANPAGCWLYRFDLDTTIEFRGKLMQTAHACEMAFTYNAFADPECHVFSMHDPDAPGVRQLAADWSRTLTQFAHSGNPNDAGLPTWPPYDINDRRVMLLDQVCVVERDPEGTNRKLWST